MSRTFEELASQELDGLYQGALFLSGGDAGAAERLLVDTMTLACQEHGRGVAPGDEGRWIEGWLVRSFVRGAADVSPARDDGRRGVKRTRRRAPRRVGSASLYQAAGELPMWPRAALWLVLLRRWGYQEAADALGVARDVLQDLLRYRDVLMAGILGASGARTGTDDGMS